MSVTSGFFNSKNGDRKYNAEQMSSIFDGIIRDGIFQHIGTSMMVTAGSGMEVIVGIGRAWFKHTWTLNDSLLPLAIEPSEVLYKRIDAVVLEVDNRETVRQNSIKVVKGTPGNSPERPTLIKENDRTQYALAYVEVGAAVSSITQANITNMVGTGDTPFITAPLEKMNIDALIAQWQSQYTQWRDGLNTNAQNWRAEFEQLMNTWKTGITQNYDSWTNERRQAFNDWFENVKGQLSGDVAANLAGRIAQLEAKKIEVVDNLITDDASKPISARQGMLLNNNFKKVFGDEKVFVQRSKKPNQEEAYYGVSIGQSDLGLSWYWDNCFGLFSEGREVAHVDPGGFHINNEKFLTAWKIGGSWFGDNDPRNGELVLDTDKAKFRLNDGRYVYLSQLFQSASEGKTLCANALTGIGIPTSTTASWRTIAENIKMNKYRSGSILNANEAQIKDVGRIARWNLSSHLHTFLMEYDNYFYELTTSPTTDGFYFVLNKRHLFDISNNSPTEVIRHKMTEYGSPNFTQEISCNDEEGYFLIAYFNRRSQSETENLFRIVKIKYTGEMIVNYTIETSSIGKVYVYPYNNTICTMIGDNIKRYYIQESSVTIAESVSMQSGYMGIVPGPQYILGLSSPSNGRVVCTVYNYQGGIHHRLNNQDLGISDLNKNSLLINPCYVRRWDAFLFGFPIRDTNWTSVDRVFWLNPNAKTHGAHSDFKWHDDMSTYYSSYGDNMFSVCNKREYNNEGLLGRIWICYVSSLKSGAYIEVHRNNNLFESLQDDWHKNNFLKINGYMPTNSKNEGVMYSILPRGRFGGPLSVESYNMLRHVKLK